MLINKSPPRTINRENMKSRCSGVRSLRYDPVKYKIYLEQLYIRYPPTETEDSSLRR